MNFNIFGLDLCLRYVYQWAFFRYRLARIVDADTLEINWYPNKEEAKSYSHIKNCVIIHNHIIELVSLNNYIIHFVVNNSMCTIALFMKTIAFDICTFFICVLKIYIPFNLYLFALCVLFNNIIFFLCQSSVLQYIL